MSQFVMISAVAGIRIQHGISLRSIIGCDELFAKVAVEYSFPQSECRLVVDESESAESLLDDVHDAVVRGQPIVDTAFGALAFELVANKIPFLCWCGADFRKVPIVNDWEALAEQLTIQVRQQPADVFLCYAPSALPVARALPRS